MSLCLCLRKLFVLRFICRDDVRKWKEEYCSFHCVNLGEIFDEIASKFVDYRFILVSRFTIFKILNMDAK